MIQSSDLFAIRSNPFESAILSWKWIELLGEFTSEFTSEFSNYPSVSRVTTPEYCPANCPVNCWVKCLRECWKWIFREIWPASIGFLLTIHGAYSIRSTRSRQLDPDFKRLDSDDSTIKRNVRSPGGRSVLDTGHRTCQLNTQYLLVRNLLTW